jgi:hypothetical protein
VTNSQILLDTIRELLPLVPYGDHVQFVSSMLAHAHRLADNEPELNEMVHLKMLTDDCDRFVATVRLARMVLADCVDVYHKEQKKGKEGQADAPRPEICLQCGKKDCPNYEESV